MEILNFKDTFKAPPSPVNELNHVLEAKNVELSQVFSNTEWLSPNWTVFLLINLESRWINRRTLQIGRRIKVNEYFIYLWF